MSFLQGTINYFHNYVVFDIFSKNKSKVLHSIYFGSVIILCASLIGSLYMLYIHQYQLAVNSINGAMLIINLLALVILITANFNRIATFTLLAAALLVNIGFFTKQIFVQDQQSFSHILFLAIMVILAALLRCGIFIIGISLVILMINILLPLVGIPLLSNELNSAFIFDFYNSSSSLAAMSLIMGIIIYVNQSAITAAEAALLKNKLDNEKMFHIIHLTSEASEHLIETSQNIFTASQEIIKRGCGQNDSVERIANLLEEVTGAEDTILDNLSYQNRRMQLLFERIRSLFEIVQDEGSSMKEAMAVMQQLDANIDDVKVRINDTMMLMQIAVKDAASMLASSKVINEVADKTHMLSLNAAIEAARAGERGRGFAVVASEISKLADMTSNNADEISSIVVSTSKGMERSFVSLETAMARIGIIFDELKVFGIIIKRIEDLARKDLAINSYLQEDARHFIKRASEIIATIENQRALNDSIKQIIPNISDMVCENAAASTELSLSSAELNSESTRIQSLMQLIEQNERTYAAPHAIPYRAPSSIPRES